MTRRAKIVATLGPASQDRAQIRAMALAGMDVVRLNFSHGDRRSHAGLIETVREVSEELKTPIGILQDLQGPKLRVGNLASPLLLEAGQKLVLTTEQADGSQGRVHVEYQALPEDVNPGDTILLDDGNLELTVKEVENLSVHTEVVLGGTLTSGKGINLPTSRLSAPCLTAKDIEDLAFGLKHGIDFLAISFVRRANDVYELWEHVQRLEPDRRRVPIIAKLERPEAIENLEQILQAADGVMVARGDLGVELSAERVPSIQKRIILSANRHYKTVITATQMLDSMIRNPRPTRAEASDVANAVFDGTDALMLSGETAIGKYPLQAIKTMARIIDDAESHTLEWGLSWKQQSGVIDDAIATTQAAHKLAEDRNVTAIAVFTRSGRTARLMAKSRPQAPIMAFTPDRETYFQLSLIWDVIPQLIPMANTVEEMISIVNQACLDSKLVLPGDQVVMVASLPVGEMGPPNFTFLNSVQ